MKDSRKKEAAHQVVEHKSAIGMEDGYHVKQVPHVCRKACSVELQERRNMQKFAMRAVQEN